MFACSAVESQPTAATDQQRLTFIPDPSCSLCHKRKEEKKVGPTKKLVYACISKLYLLSLIPQSRLYDIVVSRLNGHRRCWQSTTGRIALWTSLGVWHLRWRIGLAIKRFERRRRQRAKEEYWFSIGKILFLSSLWSILICSLVAVVDSRRVFNLTPSGCSVRYARFGTQHIRINEKTVRFSLFFE